MTANRVHRQGGRQIRSNQLRVDALHALAADLPVPLPGDVCRRRQEDCIRQRIRRTECKPPFTGKGNNASLTVIISALGQDLPIRSL